MQPYLLKTKKLLRENIFSALSYTFFSLKVKMLHELCLSRAEYIQKNRSIAFKQMDKYFIAQKIGEGSYGAVFRGWNEETKEQVAFKVFDLLEIEDQINSRIKAIRKRLIRTEAELMTQLNSDHIIKCFDIYQNEELKIIVTEYFSEGTLTKKIIKNFPLQEDVALDYMRQILKGVSEMHKKGIVHRDLKADNIMFHKGVIKIIDLGFSKRIEDKLTKTPLGTIYAMAPQILQRKPYGYKADIWSLGILFHQMIYGPMPYYPKPADKLLEQIKHRDIFPNNGKKNGIAPSVQMIDFLKGLLMFDPKKRMGWQEIKHHPIFQNQRALPDTFRIRRKLSDVSQWNVNLITDQDFMQMIERDEEKQKNLHNKEKKKFKDLTTKQIEKKKMQLLTDEGFEWGKKKHLQCLKAEFIVKNIIIPLEQKQLLSLKKKVNLQFFYLLSATCFKNMSFVNFQTKQTKKKYRKFLQETVLFLYEIVKQKFDKYSKLLQKEENTIGSMISDKFFSIFYSKQKDYKDSIINGIENLDYKKEEFIEYIYHTYIKQIIKTIDEEKHFQLCHYLQYYREINFLTLQVLREKLFSTWVKQLHKQEKQK